MEVAVCVVGGYAARDLKDHGICLVMFAYYNCKGRDGADCGKTCVYFQPNSPLSQRKPLQADTNNKHHEEEDSFSVTSSYPSMTLTF